MAFGWAVIGADGVIEVRTVSDTRRAAMVNWLVCDGLMVLNVASDDTIEKAFALRATPRYSVKRVLVKEYEELPNGKALPAQEDRRRVRGH